MSPAATQAHIPIASLEEGIAILKDGSLAVILRIYPINFDLKNQSEQNVVISRYQQFLNSIDFPIQIVIRSKELDLKPYLMDLSKRTANLGTELLQRQAIDYVEFVSKLVEVGTIMSKHYYVVLQYHHEQAGSGGLFNFGHSEPTLTRSEFERIRTELNNRANTVASGLMSIGLRVEALDTQQLIELFYSIYNPEISNMERLTNVDNLQAGIVSTVGEQHPASAPSMTAPVAATPATAAPIAAASAPTQNSLVAPGQTGSGDAINITAGTQQDISTTVGAAVVPLEAQQKADATTKAPVPGAPVVPGAPAVGAAPTIGSSPAASPTAEAGAEPIPVPPISDIPIAPVSDAIAPAAEPNQPVAEPAAPDTSADTDVSLNIPAADQNQQYPPQP